MLSRASLITFSLAALATAAHAGVFPVQPFTYNQVDLTVTSLGGGFNLWTTHATVKNTSSEELNVFMTSTALFLNGQQATWNDQFSQWSVAGMTLSNLNAFNKIVVNPTYLDLPLDPAHGIDGIHQVDFFSVGTLKPGETGYFGLQQKVSSNVNLVQWNVAFFSTPAPGPAAIVPFAMGTLGVLRRRRKA